MDRTPTAGKQYEIIPIEGEAPAIELRGIEIESLGDQMLAAAAELKFELAARLRDEVQDLQKELRAMEKAGHA